MSLFISPEGRKRREKEYQERIFPMGLRQRDMALAALRPYIREKVNDAELLYAFVVAKQHYLDTEGDIAVVGKHLKKAGAFTEHEQRRILALVQLDANATSLTEYPDDAILELY